MIKNKKENNTKEKNTKDSAKVAINKVSKTNEIKLTFEQLFESKRFRDNYQYDFSKTILGKNTYTPLEAEEILKKFFKKGV